MELIGYLHLEQYNFADNKTTNNKGTMSSYPRTTTVCRHIFQHFSKSKKSSCSLGVVVGGLASDPATTTPKLQLDFFDLKSSCSLGVVVGGVWHQTPPTTPKLQLNFFDLKSQVEV